MFLTNATMDNGRLVDNKHDRAMRSSREDWRFLAGCHYQSGFNGNVLMSSMTGFKDLIESPMVVASTENDC